MASPGSQNIEIKVFAININNEYIAGIFGIEDSSTLNQEIITFNFRKCISGEIEFVGT